MSSVSDTALSSQKEEPEILVFVVGALVAFLSNYLAVTYAKRAVGVLLAAFGLTPKRIAAVVGVTDATVRNWRRQLMPMTEHSELKAFLTRPAVNVGRKTDGFESEIYHELERTNYLSLRQITDMIATRIGAAFSLSSARRLLERMKYRRLKAGSLPAKADTARQKEFFDGTLQPLMLKAEQDEISLYFLDASHFVLGCDFLGYVWSRCRRYIKTFSGRSRHNVLGALSYAGQQLFTVENDEYITATQVCEMLYKLAAECRAKKSGPVYIVLDNARYQKCKIVTELARKLDIELVYLPPYSPNLNLIERLWKLVKSELRLRYYSDFNTFKDRITEILDGLWTTYRERTRNLLTKPQLFDALRPVCENTCEMPPKDTAGVA